MIGGANKWTAWVKEWAEKNDVTYSCAVSIPECNQEYHAKYGTKPSKKTLERQQARKAVQTGKKQTKAQASLAEMGKTAKAKVAVASAVVEKIKKRRGRPPKVAEPEADFEITPVKRMAPPSTPPPISKAQVEAVKSKMSPPEDSKARKAQASRDRMAKLRAERKAQGVSATGKTKMAKKADNITLEVMEIAEPTQSTKQGFSQKTIDEVKSALLARVALAKEIPQQATASPTLVPTAPKSKGRLKASEVQEFASRLPEGLEKYTASFLLENDPLKEFDNKDGLYALYYSLGLLGDFPSISERGNEIEGFPEVGVVKYGKQFTRTQKYAVVLPDWAGRVTPRGTEGVALSPDRVIDNMPKVESAIETIMAKNRQSDWDVRCYYGGGMGSKNTIRCIVRWRGKKGQRGQDALWRDYWIANIRPLMMDTTRWEKALERVSERREGVLAQKAVAVQDRNAELSRIGAEAIKTDKSVAELMKIVQVTLAETNMRVQGYTAWKEKDANWIIGRMKEIFDQPSKQTGTAYGKHPKTGEYGHHPVMSRDLRPVWRDFKERVQAVPLGNFSEKKRNALEKAYHDWEHIHIEEESYDNSEDWELAIELEKDDILKKYGVSEKDFNAYKKLKRGKGFSGGAVCEPCLADYDMIIQHLLEHITDPKEPVDGRDYDQAIHFIKRIRAMKGGYFKIGSRSFGKKHGGAYSDDEGETDHEDNSDDEDMLEGDEIIEEDDNPNFNPVQPWVQPIDPNQAQIDAEADALFGGLMRRMMMRRMRGAGWEEKPASSGNAFLDTITAVGHDLGKAHPAGKYVNPFDAGFKFGEKVVAPALMKTKLGNPKTGIFSKKFWTIKKKHH